MKGVSDILGEVAGIFATAFSEWRRDNASLLAAAIAYYAAFSLPPLVVLTIFLSGVFLGPAQPQGTLEKRISGFLGPEVAITVDGIVRNAASTSPDQFTTLAAAFFLFLGSTGVFLQTRRGLNVIWGIKTASGGAIRNALKSYLLSFVELVIAGIIILVCASLTIVTASTRRVLRGVLPFNYTLLHMTNFLIFFLAVCFIFASAYKMLSGVRLRWSDVLFGSAFAAAGFFAGNFLIGFYVGAGDVGSAYGAASYIFVLLFWVYYSAQIFFFGAELTKVYARKFGSQKGFKQENLCR